MATAFCSLCLALPLPAQEYLTQQKSSETEKTRRLSEAVEEQSNEVKRLADELNELRALLTRDSAPAPVQLPDPPAQPAPSDNTTSGPESGQTAQQPDRTPTNPTLTPPQPEPKPQPPTPPRPEPDPEPESPRQTVVHQVNAGETLTAIANKYGTTWQKIAEANAIDDPKLVRVGQKLKIPGITQGVTAAVPDPTPAPKPPAPKPNPGATQETPETITVASGDTLSSIARKNNTTLAALIAANPGIAPERLQVGQKIRITPGAPSPQRTERAVPMTIHVVKEGETLSSIARQYGTTTTALVALNQLPDSGHIRIGQKLQVPAKPDPSSAHTTPLPPVPAPIANDKLVPYEVKAGETLYGIGRKFFLGAEEIAQLNNIPSDYKLRAGQELLVPMHVLYSRSVAPVSELQDLR